MVPVGNRITDGQWKRYNAVRPAFKEGYENPFMVYMRVGGQYGYVGGDEVAEQMSQCNHMLAWLNAEPNVAAEISKLQHPIGKIFNTSEVRSQKYTWDITGDPAIQSMFGLDRSQTHFSPKQDGVVLAKFNRGNNVCSTTNGRSAAKFCIPHDVVLNDEDINFIPPIQLQTARANASDNAAVSETRESDPMTSEEDDETDDDDKASSSASEEEVSSEELLMGMAAVPQPPILLAAAVGEEVVKDFGDLGVTFLQYIQLMQFVLLVHFL
jgi:hypothetical protein